MVLTSNLELVCIMMMAQNGHCLEGLHDCGEMISGKLQVVL